MKELSAVLAAFYEATQCEAALWTQPRPGAVPALEAAAPPEPTSRPNAAVAPGTTATVDSPGGPALVTTISGSRLTWLVVGPCADRTRPPDVYLKFLLPVVTQYLHAALEVEHAATELAERYEEINLLYTISEILGRTVALPEAASTILTEVSETVGARRGSILVHDRVTDTLQAVAALGVRVEDVPPIGVDDPCSVSACVFSKQQSMIVEGEQMPCEEERLYRRGAMLSVPIMWTAPDGSEPLGVVNLSDRRSGQPFTAGDQKLVAAIATQIGSAIQNARLVRASLAQQQLVHEMHLAHDLQMKLLPDTSIVAPEAQVAARVVPAESVGGDYYHLFRLGRGRTGLMIGDVSSHGYRAALIMALAMSAAAIHAQAIPDPAETLEALLGSLRDELTTTEMFISSFYGIVDAERGTLRYANTGHPHAFVISQAGKVERLPAIDPPLGMTDGSPSARTRAWARGRDLLLLFTDGISDARNRLDDRLGEAAVLDTVRQHRDDVPSAIVDRVFDVVQAHTGDVPLRDDQTLVVMRS